MSHWPIIEQMLKRFAAEGFHLRRDRRHPDQRLYLERAVETAFRGKHQGQVALTMQQAEGGFGKTPPLLIAATVYAALTGRQVLIATSTTNLRDTMERLLLEPDPLNPEEPDYLGAIEAITGKRLKVGVLRGIRDFLDRDRARALLALTHDDKIRPALSFLANYPNGHVELRHAVEEWVADGRDWPERLFVGDVAALRGTHEIVMQRRQVRDEADIVLCTHAMLLRGSIYGRGRNPSNYGLLGLPRIGHVSIDEADRLVIAGEQLVLQQFSLMEMRDLLSEIRTQVGRNDTEEADRALAGLHDLMSEVARDFKVKRGDTLIATGMPANSFINASYFHRFIDHKLVPQLRRVHATFQGLLPSLAGRPTLEETTDDLVQSLDSFISFQRSDRSGLMSDLANSEVFLRWSPTLSYPSFGEVALFPARLVSRIWQQSENRIAPDSIHFTSATLEPPGSEQANFPVFSRNIGVFVNAKEKRSNDPAVNYDLCGIYRLRDFGLMRFWFPHPDAPTPTRPKKEALSGLDNDLEELADERLRERLTNPTWIEYVAKMIRHAAGTNKATYVYCLSHADKTDLARLLADLGDRLIVHERGRALPMQQWKAKRHLGPVMLSCAQEGFNITDMDVLVKTRLPLSPPHDAAMTLAKEERHGRSFLPTPHAIFKAQWGEAVSRFYQILCRSVRRPDAEVEVWFGDSRLPLPEDLYEREFPTASPYGHHYGEFLKGIPYRFAEGAEATLPEAKVWDYLPEQDGPRPTKKVTKRKRAA